MRRPFKHFDLPTYHLRGADYIPARAQHDDEIDRRRFLPQGSVLLEQQARGLHVALRTIEQLKQEEDLQILGSIAAAAAFNTSWYLFGRDAKLERMRRRLELMNVYDDTNDTRQDADAFYTNVTESFGSSAQLATDIADSHKVYERTDRNRTLLGRQLGSVATGLANLTTLHTSAINDPYELSLIARENALQALHTASSTQGNTHLSMAQFADPYSDASVEIYRHAPITIKRALRSAQEEYHV